MKILRLIFLLVILFLLHLSWKNQKVEYKTLTKTTKIESHATSDLSLQRQASTEIND